MKQVLAVAVAALLIAVAIVVRGALDDDSDDGPAGDGNDDELVIACVPELRAACERLDGEVRIEAPAATIGSRGEVDAWITFDPWPDIAELRAGQPLFDEAPVAVAGTNLVLLTRTDALPDACSPAPDWVCVTESDNEPALPGDDTALGALLLGHAALGWNLVVRNGQSFARQDAESAEFDAWLRSIDFGGDPVTDMVQIGRAGPAATGTTAATFEADVQTSREADNLAATPTPVAATAAVIAVGPAADRVADDADFRDGLVALGWRLDPDAATTGLPNAGVLFALQEIA